MTFASHNVYLLTEHNERYLALLSELDLPDLTFTQDKAEATILLAAPPMAAKAMDQFPNLEWIQSIYAGVDALVPHLQDFEGVLTNVKGIFGQQISEYVLGYVIAHQRHFAHYQSEQQKAQWTPKPYTSLNEFNMVILGTGSIGTHLAQSAKALGMRVSGVNRSGIPSKHSPFDTLYHVQELTTALAGANVVVNTLPNTPDTQHILNHQTLSHLDQSLLFNVGRGAALDEHALIEAIEQGCVQHAFLDVFEQEPLHHEHPFWSHPHITVTPHIAALSFPEQAAEIFAENYARWRDGFRLLHVVEPKRGY